MTLRPGVALGPYAILSHIGAGGMGEVWKARDTRLERTVAIKVSAAKFTERFEREARAVAALNHPNICTLHDIGHQDGIDYLVMEYLEGQTLAARLERGPLPIEQVFAYALAIADALDKAHRMGITHRDIKPANIVLTKSGIKLLDFGLAKLTPQATAAGAASDMRTAPSALTGEGTIIGTLHYMAPEQLEGGEADARADIFAFGAVVYEMATGKRAFEGKSQASVIGAIMSADPPAMISLQPLTPKAFERLVRRCLAKDREERWQGASDLKWELERIAEGRTEIPRQGEPRTAWIWKVLAGLFAIFWIAVSMVHFREKPTEASLVRWSLPAPEKTRFARPSGGLNVRCFTGWQRHCFPRDFHRGQDADLDSPVRFTHGAAPGRN